jgi:hypothetical protein
MKESRPYPRIYRSGEGTHVEQVSQPRYAFGQPALRDDGKYVSTIEPPVVDTDLPRFTQFIANMNKIPGSERFAFEIEEGVLLPDGVTKGRRFFLTFAKPQAEDEDGFRLIGTMLPMYARHINDPAQPEKKKR